MKKPLDIVRTPRGGIAVITETSIPHNGGSVTHSLDYIDNPHGEHNAWWQDDNLQYLHSIPALITNAMAHPFGNSTHTGKLFFPPEIDFLTEPRLE
jgi:hypothetical protein